MSFKSFICIYALVLRRWVLRPDCIGKPWKYRTVVSDLKRYYQCRARTNPGVCGWRGSTREKKTMQIMWKTLEEGIIWEVVMQVTQGWPERRWDEVSGSTLAEPKYWLFIYLGKKNSFVLLPLRDKNREQDSLSSRSQWKQRGGERSVWCWLKKMFYYHKLS